MKRIIFLLLIAGCTATGSIIEEIIPEETISSPDLFFCPGDCENVLVDFLNSSQQSIHCAFYDMDLESAIDLLDKKSRDIEVRLVIDDTYYEELENFSFVRTDTSGKLMHNKFCIIDNKKILTGSMNPTYRGANLNNNNLIIIESGYLSENYETEFDELWNKKENKKTKYQKIMINNNLYENYFCPEDRCSEKVIDIIKNAQNSIYFMTFSFTHPGIANELVIKLHQGLDIKGIFEKRQISKYSQYGLLDFQGIDVRTGKNKYNMHHKVFIIDNETVITGSFNPTKNADKRNDENLLIIKDRNIAKRFLEEFKKLS